VEEDTPKLFTYYRKYGVSEGPPTTITCTILAYNDPGNTGAPQLKERKYADKTAM